MGDSEQRRYRSDDADLSGHDNDLLVFQGGNGDWYISIVKHGEKIGPAVRIRTSGGPVNQPMAGAGACRLWHGLQIEEPGSPWGCEKEKQEPTACRHCGHSADAHGFVGHDIRSECCECSCVRYLDDELVAELDGPVAT
jgi:hypothetical protein